MSLTVNPYGTFEIMHHLDYPRDFYVDQTLCVQIPCSYLYDEEGSALYNKVDTRKHLVKLLGY